jgi:uncharacterized membrane protein
MARIEHTVEVDLPVDIVWDVWSDVRRLPELSKSTIEVRGAPERLTRVGDSFCQIAKAAGKSAAVEWTVTSIEPCDHLVIEGSPGYGVQASITERVRSLPGGGTALTLEADYRLPFGPLGRVVSKLGLDRLAMRESCEVLAGVVRLSKQAHAEQRPLDDAAPSGAASPAPSAAS